MNIDPSDKTIPKIQFSLTLQTEILSTVTSDFLKQMIIVMSVNPIALRKAKVVYNFGLSECSRVNSMLSEVRTKFGWSCACLLKVHFW